MASRDELMDAISDLLGLPRFPKGVGSSVHNDFIDSVTAAVLGADHARRFSDKYRKIQAVIEYLGGTYVPGNPNVRGVGHTSENTKSGGGGTLTNFGLETIYDLLLQSNVRRSFGSAVDRGLESAVDFDPSVLVDTRVKALREVATRPGATRFRNRVREAYGGKCAVTGTNELLALEAAHIVPFSGEDSDHVTNGLLLRADIHGLFDALQLAIDSTSYTVVLSERLRASTYGEYQGRVILLPASKSNWPSRAALDLHRERTGL